MAQRGSLRASDEDREHIAERLRQATAEGRLAADELEQRLGAAFGARTYAELDRLVFDLPGPRSPRPRPQARRALSTVSAHPIVLVAALPFLLAAVAIATGLAAVWMTWVVFAWLAFGHQRRWPADRCRPRPRRCGPAWPARQAQAAPGSRRWT